MPGISIGRHMCGEKCKDRCSLLKHMNDMHGVEDKGARHDATWRPKTKVDANQLEKLKSECCITRLNITSWYYRKY